MFNLTEHEIYTAHKCYNASKYFSRQRVKGDGNIKSVSDMQALYIKPCNLPQTWSKSDIK